MGIRVHKCIGYGVDDLKVDENGRLKDPRIDDEKYREFNDREASAQTFLEWLKAQDPASFPSSDVVRAEFWLRWLIQDLEDSLKKGKHVRSSWFHHPSESGMEHACIFQHPNQDNWFRYDDTLDYYEEVDSDGPRGRATFLRPRIGVYPYDGTVVRFRQYTGTEMFPELIEKGRMDGGTYNQLVGEWSPNLKAMAPEPLRTHLLNDWRPEVPFGIHAVMRWMGCFPNEEDPGSLLNTIRPMILVWWC